MALICNPAKAADLMGWAPRVPLSQGLAHCADFVRTHLDRFKPDEYRL